MTTFVSWRSIVIHKFLVECTKWVSPGIPIEEILASLGDLTVFSRVNQLSVISEFRRKRPPPPIYNTTRNEGSVFIEIMASFGCLLKK